MSTLAILSSVSEDLLLTELHVKIKFNTLKKIKNTVKRVITDTKKFFKVIKVD